MSDYEKDPKSGSTKDKVGRDAADRWANEGGHIEKKDPKTPSMSADTPRTDEGKKYEESEESASERSDRDQS